ncbi:acyltransferase domain-containing protein, partial [Actinomadura fulvescens]|uniref:acyltransferase domain-containing protein n=1 Tax=Actinomadura fulvescens TaxID=46160 RepID=UPI003978E192
MTQGQGRMAAVGLPQDQARPILEAYPGLEIAAVNTDRDVTIAGPAKSLKLLAQEMARREVYYRELEVDYPFHSAAMDPIQDRLSERLADLAPAPTQIPLLSTVTGGPVHGTDLNADYWWCNVREPVRFAAAVGQAIAQGADVLVEVGPHPVLRSY